MQTLTKHLDRKFLSAYYQDKKYHVDEVFETFLSEAPDEIIHICELFNSQNIIVAREKMQNIIPSFICIGLPQLTVQLQIVEVYLNFSNISMAKILIHSFVKELETYMPAILDEYWHLIANKKIAGQTINKF